MLTLIIVLGLLSLLVLYSIGIFAAGFVVGVAKENSLQRDLEEHIIRPHIPHPIVTTTETPVDSYTTTTFVDGDDPALRMKYDTEEDFKSSNPQTFGEPDAPKKKRK